ncbi:MAG TPA: NAD-dependent epimerase/dehydratase [Patescibacteria group bacterium]|nr:NAD-dependent epimerase/dehydratase [Patescibacteria group bacterium]
MDSRDSIKRLKGPIGIFGAGGFIGINLLQAIFTVRSDVIGFSRNPKQSWRINSCKIPRSHFVICNLLDNKSIQSVIKKHKPQTIFNLGAYGAYPKQKDIEKIYQTNFLSTVYLIEVLKNHGFSVYIHAGSQSEYGLNATAPHERDELIPNSHYAISKTATHYLLKYYGRVEKLPVAHLRLYSVYGPWEEPDRLIPVLLQKAKEKKLPHFVDAEISRDFIFVEDVLEAMIVVARRLKPSYFGDTFNIASGKKTTMKELATLSKKIFDIDQNPIFDTMKQRNWDVKNWYGSAAKMEKVFSWKAKTKLKDGLLKTYEKIS